VVARDWRTSVPQVLDLLQSEKQELEVANAFTDIMLKILVIPTAQNKSATELISIFGKLYEQMLKHASVMLAVKVNQVLNEHLEAAFKLTTRQELHYRNRAYQWLEAITEVCPKSFWVERKRRTVKTIYTHAVEIAKSSGDEQHRESALKVALKF